MLEATTHGAARDRAGDHFRWVKFGICAGAMFIEGYDTQSIGYAVPVITKDWNLGPGALAPALSSGLFGLMLGALLIAPLADKIGRKKVLVGSVLAFGLVTLATMYARSLNALIILRLLTGLGIGGAMPNAAALTAEFVPLAKRARSVSIMFVFFSLGAGVGGLLAARLMPLWGWQAVFLAGGAGALAFVPVMICGLPESLSVNTKEQSRLPIAKLLQNGRARVTLLFWVVFVGTLMDLYLLSSWLPTTITSQGIDVSTAAVATSLVQIGGIGGGLVLGFATDRFGAHVVLPLTYLFAAFCIAAIGLAGASVPLIMAAATGAGVGVIGAQTVNNGVAAKFYPEAIRATGVGWALGIGRIGSVIGPAIGGVLLAEHVDIRTIFLLSAVPALVAAVVYLFIGRLPQSDDA